ncbi:Uncharacterized protein dnm_016860 [Desulfonema magnum]|uniref:Uncharacterized protein n=1 Tax=Desulfonema magnum TaxID=45655 RepID=A0A975BHL6_9BACT|nr:Uncharacterized protein dnm_016860 [Desulfonema magnum]
MQAGPLLRPFTAVMRTLLSAKFVRVSIFTGVSRLLHKDRFYV